VEKDCVGTGLFFCRGPHHIGRRTAEMTTYRLDALISAHHGIEYWNDIPNVIEQAAELGEDVQTPDEHWNELGHQLVAGMVAKHMQERGVTIARHR
jgi:hypothetical protein